ncbi:MAG: T9SS type A sorting domain-containing protein, partial [Bacteroidota bacterium]
TMLAIAFMLVGTATVQAQDEAMDVTIRQINSIRPSALDSLRTLGETLDPATIQELATPALDGQRVRFTAFVMTNVRNSGLATYRPASSPPIGRVHLFVRDTSAISSGVDGMDLQLVDGDFESTGILNTFPGDVIEVDGVVTPFTGDGGVSMQVSPISVTVTGETFADFGADESILDPVTVTTDEINAVLGDGVTINWDNYERLLGQFVRIEGARVVQRDLGIDDQRPDFDFTSDGGTTRVNMLDMSLRYRNDRNGEYYGSETDGAADDFNVRARDDEYVPPPPGAVINIQGHIVFQGDDPFGVAPIENIAFSLAPFEDSDVVITESPPIVSLPSSPDFVPGADAVDVTFDASADVNSGRSLDTVELFFYTSSNADTTAATAVSDDGLTYTFSIPGAADGDFVTYFALATDNTGATSETEDVVYRVLADGINELIDIQETVDGQPGFGPFTGITTDMDVTVTIQSDPATSGLVSAQDKEGLDAWSGIFLAGDGLGDLAQGDVIRITNAEVEERFDVTQLTNITFETVSTGGETLGYKTVTTDILQDGAIAEAHEGMLLRFESPVITSIERFGEWGFSTDGTEENAVLADDQSDGLPGDFNETVLAQFQRLEFLQGIWWFSFGNFKLVPESPADAGAVINVSIDEDSELPNQIALDQNYPNPFNPVTRIAYTVPQLTDVRLSVYDVLGREVAVLVNGQLAAGTYEASFNASTLSSGLYVYRLEAGTQTLVRTMTVLK